MNSFFVPDLRHQEVRFPEDEAGHASRVLRLKEDTAVLLVDGKGTHAQAVLSLVTKNEVRARIIERAMVPMEEPMIHLAVSPTKQLDRFEWLLEKCTELGVHRITPLITARTERERVRGDRMEKIIVAAMKQSQRAWLPQLDPPIALDLFMSEALPQQRLFGWCEGERADLVKSCDKSQDALMLIGPEGDFTDEEARALIEHSFLPVSLGTARLRTETAAMAAVAWFNFTRRI